MGKSALHIFEKIGVQTAAEEASEANPQNGEKMKKRGCINSPKSYLLSTSAFTFSRHTAIFRYYCPDGGFARVDSKLLN